MRNPRLMAAFLLAGSLAGAFALWQAGAADLSPDAATLWLQDLGARPGMRWFLFGAVFLGGLVVFPIMPVVMFTGAVYGQAAFVATWASMLLSCLACYALGRYAGVAPRSHGGKAERIAGFVRRHGMLSAFLARFIPAFPMALQNLLLGAARVPLGAFILGSLLSVGVVAAAFLSAGAAGAKALDDIHRAIHFGWIMPAVGLLAAGYLWRSGRSLPVPKEVPHDFDRTGA